MPNLLPTMAGKPSSPAAFQALAVNILRSTSCILSQGVGIGRRCGRDPSSSIVASSRGKKVVSSSSACPAAFSVRDPSALGSGGIFAYAELSSVLRYLAACQTLMSSLIISPMRFFLASYRVVIFFSGATRPGFEVGERQAHAPSGSGLVSPVGVSSTELREVFSPPFLCVWSWLGFWGERMDCC